MRGVLAQNRVCNITNTAELITYTINWRAERVIFAALSILSKKRI